MDFATGIPDLVERAWKIKEAFEEYRENQTTLYRLSAELLDDVEELESLRKGYVSNNLPTLDHNLSLLKSGFENVLDRYEKLLVQQQRKNPLYKGLALLTTKKIKDEIKDLNNEIAKARSKFLVRTNAQIVAQTSAAFPEIRAEATNLAHDLGGIIQAAQKDPAQAGRLFGIDDMNTERKKKSLKKASLDLAAASKDADVRALSLKIKALEHALDKEPIIFSPNRAAVPEGYSSEYIVYEHDYSDPKRKREDALVEIISLLHMFDDHTSEMPTIAWFYRALTLGRVLHDIGLHSEALQLERLNTEVIQKLAEGHGNLYDPDLAASLLNLSESFSEVGRHEEALEAIQKAVSIMQGLSEKDKDGFNPVLAGCLHDLSVHLSNLDKHKEALEAIKKAVTINQALSEKDPDRFNPVLSDSLHQLSFILTNLDRHKEALEASQKAVVIKQALSKKHPDRFNPDLADFLNGLSCSFLKLGRHAEATVHIQESIALFESLLKEKQIQEYDRNFGRALETYSDVLEVTGQHRKALEIARKAVTIFQKHSGILSQVEKRDLDVLQRRIARLEFT
ncbi:hypothetical protein DFH11DRAFT_1272739 [Phellopilus nigrolimitatus]|nr:hypothetical protein DFH11DRAFT_1272739 [Phellopilus nigrolimitatus]